MARTKTAARRQLSALPVRGFINSIPRQDVPLDAMTGPSLDWLVGRKKLRRRDGTTVIITGILEAGNLQRMRRMYAANLPSVTDGYPSPLMLFVCESLNYATLGWRSTNGTDTYRQVGLEFDATTYPDTGVPQHRVVNLIYENRYGGVTMHRLNNAEGRASWLAGSRDFLQVGTQVCAPGGNSLPVRWNSRFKDAVSTDAAEVFPLGMIQPLQMPSCTAGNDLGTSAVDGATYKGSQAFFFSVCFENDKGELSGPAIPRPPGSAWQAYPGFGYVQVDSANPTHFKDSMVYANLPQGPPGTRWIRLMRGLKVDLANTVDTSAGKIVQPAASPMGFFAKVPQGTTTYTDADGNDAVLDFDPRIADVFSGGLQWPPRGRSIGRFDGHITLGGLRPSPAALLVCPWENGSVNYAIDDANLYPSTPYFAAVTPNALVLRKVVAGSTTQVGATDSVNAPTKIGLPDYVDMVVGATITGTGIPGATTISSLAPLVDTGCQTTVSSTSCVVTNSTLNRVGQLVTGPGIQLGTTVTAKPDGTHVTLSLPATVTATGVRLVFAQATISNAATATNTGVTFTISTTYTDTIIPLSGETLRSIVDYITSDVSITNTIYTGCTNPSILRQIIDVGAAIAGLYVGDRVVSGAYPADTVITSITTGGNKITVSHPSTRALAGGGEQITFQHRVGSTNIRYGAQVVFGADADETADSLLRTRVTVTGTFGASDTTITCLAGEDTYVTPGMLVNHSSFPSNVVTAVDTTTHTITVSPGSNSATGSGGDVDFGYDTGDTTLGKGIGFVRMFGNAFPAIVYWNTDYLAQFDDSMQDSIFTAASPGYAQDGINTWMLRNRQRGNAPASFGELIGMADLGPLELQFYARGRMELYNPRTGLTHADTDYNKIAVSWTRGARSPYAICAGNKWAISVCDEGVYVCDAQGGEALLSEAIYRAGRPVGSRGELEYAIKASIAASESGSDDYKIAASVVNGVLRVQYYTDSAQTYYNREIHYDFSDSLGRSGIMGVLQADGTPYPWSAPQTIRVSCMAQMAQADGAVHLFAGCDVTVGGGDPDGRLMEIDTGSDDDGVKIRPVGYSGLHLAEGLQKIQPTTVRVISTKAGSGLGVALTRSPEKDPETSPWDTVDIPSSGVDAFGRAIVLLKPAAAGKRIAVAVKITDDGSGSGAEVSALLVDAEDRASVE